MSDNVTDLFEKPEGTFSCAGCQGINFNIDGSKIYCSHCGSFMLNVKALYRSEAEIAQLEKEYEDGCKDG